MIEADIHSLRQEVMERIIERSSVSGKWNFHLITLLLDDKPTIDSRGQIRLARQQYSMTELSKFILYLYGFLAGSTSNYFAQHGWEAFRNLIVIRNRVTHPKSDMDVFLSESDLAIIEQAKTWYLNTLADIAKAQIVSSGKAIRVDEIPIPFFDDLADIQ